MSDAPVQHTNSNSQSAVVAAESFLDLDVSTATATTVSSELVPGRMVLNRRTGEWSPADHWGRPLPGPLSPAVPGQMPVAIRHLPAPKYNVGQEIVYYSPTLRRDIVSMITKHDYVNVGPIGSGLREWKYMIENRPGYVDTKNIIGEYQHERPKFPISREILNRSFVDRKNIVKRSSSDSSNSNSQSASAAAESFLDVDASRAGSDPIYVPVNPAGSGRRLDAVPILYPNLGVGRPTDPKKYLAPTPLEAYRSSSSGTSIPGHARVLPPVPGKYFGSAAKYNEGGPNSLDQYQKMTKDGDYYIGHIDGNAYRQIHPKPSSNDFHRNMIWLKKSQSMSFLSLHNAIVPKSLSVTNTSLTTSHNVNLIMGGEIMVVLTVIVFIVIKIVRKLTSNGSKANLKSINLDCDVTNYGSTTVTTNFKSTNYSNVKNDSLGEFVDLEEGVA